MAARPAKSRRSNKARAKSAAKKAPVKRSAAKKAAGKKAPMKKAAVQRNASKRPARSAASLPAEWALLEPLLTVSLASMKPEQFLVLACSDVHRFVQFAVGPKGAIRGEVVSDHFLEDGEKLSASEVRAIAAAGWQAPTQRDDTPSSDGEGSPNWYRDFTGPKAAARAAEAAIATLWRAFRHRPSQVRYNAFAKSGEELELPLAGIQPEEEWMSPGFRADDLDELREMVLQTLQGTEVGEIRAVEGVDIAVDVGERSVFVTAHDEPLSVLLYSVVGQLEEDGDSLALVNELNRSRAGMRAILYEGHLLVDRVLPADPFVPRQLVEAVVELVAWANAIEHGDHGENAEPAGAGTSEGTH
jgi:hypothetical protein